MRRCLTVLMLAATLQGCRGDDPTAPGPARTVEVPVVWASVVPGYNSDFGPSTCGLTVAGIPYCWSGGPRGDTTLTPRTDTHRPIPVAGGLIFQQITDGWRHRCGLTAAGVAHCWRNTEYRNGRVSYSGLPVAINVPRPLRMINAAGSTCGVADDGAVYCWASEDSVATLVPGGVRLRTVSLGGPYLFTCGVAVDGAGYCWGANEVGQLGLGRADPVDAAWPTTPQRVVGGHRFRTISAGYEHACGVTEGGVAYCWGLNNYGRLGTGTARTTPGVPAPVAGDLRFSTVSAAHDHSCGLTEAGAAYCWGHNDRGQLGTGSVGGPGTFSAVPVPVAGGLQFVTLAARSYHTCAVTAAGEAYCWGDNSSGQLGDGSPSPDRSRGPQPYRNDFRGVPTRVVHPRAFVGG